MKNLKILTFNWHESYIHLLAKTGYGFDVVERWKGGRYGWIHEFRPVPPNCRLISEDEAKSGLKSGIYDRVIAHNINDLLFVHEFPIPKVLVFHNKLSCEITLGGNVVNKEEYIKQIYQLFSETKNLTLVFISKAKRDDWGLNGEIILPGIDISEYGGYRGSIKRVLRVGNGLKARDIMLGFTVQDRLLDGINSTIVGLNPDIHGSRIPGDWEDFKEFMRSHRVYLNTTLYPYEDGYNLAMLEAMATGMPVVSIANPTSPIEDGVNGFVSDDIAYLRSKVEELLGNQALANTLGKMARETVISRFPIDRFISDWRRVLGDAAYKGKHYDLTISSTTEEPKRLRILMSYTSNPQTTAAYIEKALRKSHDVITYGPTISDEVLKAWNLMAVKDRVKDHDIPYFTPDIEKVLLALPAGWMPDIFLWIETGVWYPLDGLKSFNCVKACYLIDTHLNFEKHVKIAKDFDGVFIAQKAYVEEFKDRGIENVFWLPLACDPEIHGKKTDKKLYDIGFVGSLNNPRRVELLNKLKERFNVYYERCFLERMAEVFSQSKIIFNNSINNDLNMRVFEALCSGSMLLTDEAAGSGLTEMFQDKRHLVIYRNEDELLELAGYYLKYDDERERIAEKGMKEVLSKHTYDHRAKEMVEILSTFIDEKKKESTVTPKSHATLLPQTVTSLDAKDRDYFRQERKDIEALIPEDTMRILDVGCGEGILGKRLLEKGVREVIGIEINPDVCKKAEYNLSQVICGDVEVMEFPFEEGYFDCIIFADLLEHLRDPLSVVKRFKKYLSDSGVIIASIPNVRYYGVINMLTEGYWKYEDYGILDRTHLRFFTKKEMEKLFADAGFEITGISANIDPRYNTLDPLLRDISFGRVTLRNLTPDELKDLFVIQYLIRAQKSGYKFIEFIGGEVTVGGNVTTDSLEEAKKRLESYLEAHPADLDMLYKYAQVCHMLGFKEKAMESLEKILIFEPEREDVIELRDKIGN